MGLHYGDPLTRQEESESFKNRKKRERICRDGPFKDWHYGFHDPLQGRLAPDALKPAPPGQGHGRPAKLAGIQ